MESTRTPGKLNLRVGEWVEVRCAQEILATLDENGCLDQLPFMPEMLKFCGKRYRVLKRANKIIDVVKKTGLRKMTGTIILESLRCDGYSHGRCQAGCHLLWKEIWLCRVPNAQHGSTESICTPNDTVDGSATQESCDHAKLSTFVRPLHNNQSGEYYRCQATEIFNASSYLSWWDPQQYFIDLWSRNVTLREFVRGALIGLFNTVQKLRGGCGYPYMEPSSNKKTPTQELNLMPGELVRVKNKKEIAATLDIWSKNRGLWFDKEMLRYCGGYFSVLKRVERTIDEKTGRLIELRNPCIILEGVTAKGDYHRFNPQNEYVFWREIWLERFAP